MTPVLRVAILGAESSGKSTLAAALASHFATVWVPEYLREFVDTTARVPREEDQYGIALTQMEREDAAARQATRFLFCDTTPLMTAIYSRWYWNRVDAQLSALEQRHDYAMTLVTAPDGPWEADGLQRESEAVRQTIHEQVIERLDERGIGYALVTGSLEERMGQAIRLLNPDR
ncbi:ATP-binding protein [Massilia atriviolacea]|uniref:Nicotinamide-nucleotide adenylyltransferase n=1 Tax=Massilia atriviolacea TaxID=2495579 RepID=A0A430HKA7_9BURK|nr:ATP-binding protein [Massilia atriviolacea]RSZ57931.1 nicotinamide-nucleotide adenylyltransferase [Massilia atriviolacea]